MSCKITVVTSGKGGVGKTTVTANLGTAIAMSGYRTLLIDMDLGLRNLDIVMGLENRVIFTLLDVLEGRCRVKQALIKDKRINNLFLLAAEQARDKEALEPEQMQKLLELLKEDFDYILLDCPAGIEKGFRNAICSAHEALVVVNPEVSSIRDADRIVGLLDSAGVKDKQLIVNRLRNDLLRKKKIFSPEDISDILGIPLLGSIQESDEVVISSNLGNPIAAGSGRISASYNALCHAYLGTTKAEAEEKRRWFHFRTT